jgi:DnaK suppressor protein
VEPNQVRHYEGLLHQMREAIASLESVRRAGSAVVELDQSRTGRLSRMDALQMQAMANAGRDRAATELRRIDAALARIRAGNFGACVECGEPIATARLDAHPAVALCLACAESREQR